MDREKLVRLAQNHFVANTVTNEEGRLIFTEKPYPELAAEFALAHCKEVVAERDRLREWVNGLQSADWDGVDFILELTPEGAVIEEYGVSEDRFALKQKWAGKTPVEAVEAYLKDKAALAGKE